MPLSTYYSNFKATVAGMPNHYIVFAEDDTDVALAKALNEVIGWDNDTRTAFGDRGKTFVECSKNPITQAQKIVALGEKCMSISDQSKSE